jgi:acyl-CoA thioester hydrolase
VSQLAALEPAWQLPNPHIVEWQIQADHIDHYDHVNNVAYVAMLEQVAWSHSNALGLNFSEYKSLDRGMAISRHEIDYLTATLLNDTLLCATWIVECDKKLKLTRKFQFIRKSDLKTVLKARTEFVCIALSSGKPKRMPKRFIEVYYKALNK